MDYSTFYKKVKAHKARKKLETLGKVKTRKKMKAISKVRKKVRASKARKKNEDNVRIKGTKVQRLVRHIST